MTENALKAWQESADEFHVMMGQCIAAWARVDDELFQIFRDCLGAPLEQAAILYYRTSGIGVRLATTDELVKSVLPKPEKKSGGHDDPSITAWKNATSGLDNLLGMRRRIAHYPVTFRPAGSGLNAVLNTTPFNESPKSWFEIYVSQHERLRGKEADAKPVRITDLKSHLKAVVELRDRLNRFFHDVLSKRHVAPFQPVHPPS